MGVSGGWRISFRIWRFFGVEGAWSGSVGESSAWALRLREVFTGAGTGAGSGTAGLPVLATLTRRADLRRDISGTIGLNDERLGRGDEVEFLFSSW